MTDTLGLQKRTRRYHTAVHSNKLILRPEQIRFLPLAIYVLKIRLLIHILCNDTQLEGIIFGLCKIIPIEFNNIGMILHLHQLHSLFLVLVQLI